MPDEPKIIKFCDNINLSQEEEYFVLKINSGEEKISYALTPAHVKRLKIALKFYVERFEGMHGTINTDWNPGVTSPIQPKDLLPKDLPARVSDATAKPKKSLRTSHKSKKKPRNA